MSDTDVYRVQYRHWNGSVSMSDNYIVEQTAKAMFEACHGYHPDLNWDNAYPAHRDLYLKYARIADGIYRTELVEDCEKYVTDG